MAIETGFDGCCVESVVAELMIIESGVEGHQVGGQ